MNDHVHSFNVPGWPRGGGSLTFAGTTALGVPCYIDDTLPDNHVSADGASFIMNRATWERQNGRPAQSRQSNPPTWQYVYESHRNYTPNTEEKKMTTLSKIQEERRDKRERAKIEAAYEAWDAALDGTRQVDATDVFAFEDGKGDAFRTRVAVRNEVGDKEVWTVTGGPSEVSTEDLLAWLIQREITPGDITWLS